jgi:hypothetical protein
MKSSNDLPDGCSVTICPGMLQEAGLIEYRRGKLHVIDRRKLEKASCECYQTMNKQLKTWDAEYA